MRTNLYPSSFIFAPSSLLGFTAAFALLALLPLVLGDAHLSLLTLVLMSAFFAQAWNLMMGFVGQLSLGHALYAGIGAYAAAVAAGSFGLSPWAGIVAGALISAAAGAAIAWLGFRFAVRGIYFTLLTIAFAEMARMLFENWDFVGGNGGYFLKTPGPGNVLWTLRGGTAFYYLAFLTLCALALLLCTLLARSRLGYLWRAVREDEDAARAIGVPALRVKILAVVISAAMTSVGGSFYALFNGSLFPGTVMGMRFSIEMIVAPILGGLGTLLGPLLGALFVVPMTEFANQTAQDLNLFGLNTLIFGVLVLLVVGLLPHGLAPAIAALVRRLRRGAKS
jgi:branched-chain amino acid transport system permease protein